LDPHGAVGYLGLKRFIGQHPQSQGIFLETAHPVKFFDVVESIIHQPVPLPGRIKELLNQKKASVKMGTKFEKFKDFLMTL
jgi:threonine synthase